MLKSGPTLWISYAEGAVSLQSVLANWIKDILTNIHHATSLCNSCIWQALPSYFSANIHDPWKYTRKCGLSMLLDGKMLQILPSVFFE